MSAKTDCQITGRDSRGNGELTERPRLLFYCQSSLGLGHTMRSLRIVRGLARDFDVCFLNGSEVIPGIAYPADIEIFNLPPVVADAEFKKLGPVQATRELPDILEERRQLLQMILERFRPALLLLELYPFGRNKFRVELDPLLERARQLGTLTVCSLRDILVQHKDPALYEERVISRLNRYFDLLLVHGDPSFCTLQETFTRVHEIQAEVHYTGYVLPQNPVVSAERSEEIIVSIGGGRFGHELAFAAVECARRMVGREAYRFHLFTGPFCPSDVLRELQSLSQGVPNLTVATFTDDLAGRLATAALSISLGGYNTTMDVLSSGVRALMMPCQNAGGMDQLGRLTRLASRGVVSILDPSDLAPERLEQRIKTCLAEAPAGISLDVNGVARTAEILRNRVRQPAGRVVVGR